VNILSPAGAQSGDSARKEKVAVNIYVGNLSFDVTEDELREQFAAFGQVSSVSLIKDKFTGKSRGFGFVEMADATQAQNAIQALNGKDFKGRSLTVNPARPREERSGGGGDRGRGGYGSDRRGGPGGQRRGGPGGAGGGRRRENW
jgi:RNA recognition motif-containing protein